MLAIDDGWICSLLCLQYMLGGLGPCNAIGAGESI